MTFNLVEPIASRYNRAEFERVGELPSAPTFHLTKWYLDCVSEDGDVAIVYGAELRWRRVHLFLSSLLTRLRNEVETKTTISPCEVDEGATLSVNCPALGVSGNWERLDPPIGETLLETTRGSVRWDCMQPRARARVQLRNDVVRGLGYAERLTLTIPPWQLPLRRLQWGRAISEDDSVVWIDWADGEARRWVWKNSRPVSAALDVTGVRMTDSDCVHLDRLATLRDGTLGTTILPGAPVLRRAFPRSVFGIREQKWLSQSEHVSAAGRSSGWAIHEVVDWTA